MLQYFDDFATSRAPIYRCIGLCQHKMLCFEARTGQYRFAPKTARFRNTVVLDESLEAAKLASDECVSKGITSFQDAGLPFAQIDYLKSVVD